MKKLICINCPVGCQLSITEENDEIKIKGNKCKRGIEYGIQEIKNPMRTITSTVKVLGGNKNLVSVKTDKDVPKKLIFNIMDEIKRVEIKAPVRIGDIVIENILNTGANIVATSACDTKNKIN